jgi:hypothetical protein
MGANGMKLFFYKLAVIAALLGGYWMARAAHVETLAQAGKIRLAQQMEDARREVETEYKNDRTGTIYRPSVEMVQSRFLQKAMSNCQGDLLTNMLWPSC